MDNVKIKKRGGIRAINQGTRYDISGGLQKLARQIERGEVPHLKNLCVVWEEREKPNHFPVVQMRAYGTGTVDTHHFMLSSAAARLDVS